jgi:transposase
MSKNALSIGTAEHWFHRFRNGSLELADLPNTGRPLQVDIDVLKQLEGGVGVGVDDEWEQYPHLPSKS